MHNPTPGPIVDKVGLDARPVPLTAVCELTRSDVPRLSTFMRKAWAEAGPGALGWTGATDASMQEIASAEFLEGLLANPKTRVLAAEDAGEIIGIAVLRREEGTVDELAGIILLESRTGQGVGRSLLQATLAKSQANGATNVVVRTEAANERALEFYQKAGFVVEGRGLQDVEGAPVVLVTLRYKPVARHGNARGQF